MSKFIPRILLITLSLCLASCSWFGTKEQEPLKDAATMYRIAKEQANDGSYEAAIKSYEQLEARYPYGVYAQQAQLDVAHVHYKSGDQGSAIAACDRFIKLYPNHPKVDYAYYLKALALVGTAGSDSFTSFLTPIQPIYERDPKGLEEAFDIFRYLIAKFPSSIYLEDAQKQIVTIVDALAAHELLVARYYMSRRAPLAAVNRAQHVLTTFPGSRSTEEALALMIEGYDRLKMTDLRDDATRVLKQNYPQSAFLQK